MSSLRMIGAGDCKENRGSCEVDFKSKALPPRLELRFESEKYCIWLVGGTVVKYLSGSSACDPGREITSTLFSERADLKARGCAGGLEVRDARFSNYKNHYIGEIQVAESLDIQGQFVDVEFTLRWGPCFAAIRRRSSMAYCCILVRPIAPYRDWVTARTPPVDFGDDLVAESPFRRRCSLFGLSQDAETQTDDAVALEIIGHERPSGSQVDRADSVVSSFSTALASKKAPPAWTSVAPDRRFRSQSRCKIRD